MNEKNNNPKVSAFIRNLMKDKSEKEQLEAEQRFIDYILVAKRIFDRQEVNLSNSIDELEK